MVGHGIAKQIDINEFLTLSRDELYSRFPDGYEVVLPPDDSNVILGRCEWFYDPLAQVKQLLAQPGWLPDNGNELALSCCDSKAQEIANLVVSTLHSLDV
jgi:hypothetical protein